MCALDELGKAESWSSIANAMGRGVAFDGETIDSPIGDGVPHRCTSTTIVRPHPKLNSNANGNLLRINDAGRAPLAASTLKS